MHILQNFRYGLIVLLFGAFFSCKQGADKGGAADEKAPVADSAEAGGGTPVTLTTISTGPLNDYIDLNAVSAFLQKSFVKANANGYLQSVNTFLGKYVQQGQTLFTLKTKEAQSIGNAISALDSTFKFSGVNTIKATGQGYITQLNHQSGDYVQDGEQLAVISDMNSFVFLMNMPYELRPYIMNKRSVERLHHFEYADRRLRFPDTEHRPSRECGTLHSGEPDRQSENFKVIQDACAIPAQGRHPVGRDPVGFLGHEDDRQHYRRQSTG